MPRRSDAVITPNEVIASARKRLPSPYRLGQSISRPELADAVNRALDRLYPRRVRDSLYVDSRWVGKLERGESRWPVEERRAALRDVFGTSTDIELGLYSPRRTDEIRGAQGWSREPASIRSAELDELAAKLAEGGLVGIETVCIDQLCSREFGNKCQCSNGSPSQVGEFGNLATTFERLTVTAGVHGWGYVKSLVSRQLSALDSLRQHMGPTRGRLAVIDARWSEFMSWTCDNAGIDEGDRWLSRARERSVEAGSHVLAAYMSMRKSQRALDNGDARSAVNHSKDALRDPGLPPKTRALCLTRLAEAMALVGDESCTEVIASVGNDIENVDGHKHDSISAHCDNRYVEAARARCYYLLGDHSAAISIMEDILADSTEAAAVDIGMWLGYLAEAYAKSDPERAASVGREALKLLDRSGSARVVRALTPLSVMLRPHRQNELTDRFLVEHRAAVTALLTE